MRMQDTAETRHTNEQMILGRRVKSRYKFILSRAWANDAVSSTWLRADKGRKKQNRESRKQETRNVQESQLKDTPGWRL